MSVCELLLSPSPSYSIQFIYIKAIIQLNMQKHQQPTHQPQDIFESTIINDSPQNQNSRFQQAIRNSAMARGDQSSIMQKIIFAVGHNNKKITYQQATNNNYGFHGVLMKQSPSFFGGWDQRYCVLKGQRFVYKQNKYPTSPNAGVLNFNLLSCTLHCQKKGNYFQFFTIVITNTDKRFVFKASTLQETSQWVKKMNEAIHTSQGFGKNLSYLAHYPRFWRKDYQSEGQFRRTAQTGDVLLFRGTKNTSVMQRAITRDQYDHVAIVLLNSKRQILLFQANGGFGVGICPWNKFTSKKWYQQYDLIVHRPLKVKRNQLFSQQIDQFVSNNMGKKYDFSLKDYLFNRNSTSEEDRQQFFCSSLVAKLYKTLQLLEQNKSCTQYLPSWFSSKSSVLRGNGRYGYAYLDDQKIIVFQNIS